MKKSILTINSIARGGANHPGQHFYGCGTFEICCIGLYMLYGNTSGFILGTIHTIEGPFSISSNLNYDMYLSNELAE